MKVKGRKKKRTHAYTDNIVVFFHTWEEYMQRLKELLKWFEVVKGKGSFYEVAMLGFYVLHIVIVF